MEVSQAGRASAFAALSQAAAGGSVHDLLRLQQLLQLQGVSSDRTSLLEDPLSSASRALSSENVCFWNSGSRYTDEIYLCGGGGGGGGAKGLNLNPLHVSSRSVCSLKLRFEH